MPGVVCVILVQPAGVCSACRRSLRVGSTVRLEGVPSGNGITARVVNCISIAEYENWRIAGIGECCFQTVSAAVGPIEKLVPAEFVLVKKVRQRACQILRMNPPCPKV
jgi:hypothetical protein